MTYFITQAELKFCVFTRTHFSLLSCFKCCEVKNQIPSRLTVLSSLAAQSIGHILAQTLSYLRFRVKQKTQLVCNSLSFLMDV